MIEKLRESTSVCDISKCVTNQTKELILRAFPEKGEEGLEYTSPVKFGNSPGKFLERRCGSATSFILLLLPIIVDLQTSHESRPNHIVCLRKAVEKLRSFTRIGTKLLHNRNLSVFPLAREILEHTGVKIEKIGIVLNK